MNPGTSLRAQAAQLRIVAAELEAQADAIDRGAQRTACEALGLPELRECFGFTRESLRGAQARGLPVHRGPRGRVMAFRSDVEQWIRSRAWTPSARKAERSEDEALAQAEAELLALGGFSTRSPQAFSAASGDTGDKSPAPSTQNQALRAISGGRS